MRYFGTLPQMAAFIRRHHYAFAGRPVSDALSVLANVKAYMTECKAVLGVTFAAEQHIDGYGYLMSYITIGRDHRGVWTLAKMKV